MFERLADELARAEQTWTFSQWVFSVFMFCAVVWIGLFWKAPTAHLVEYREWVRKKHGAGMEAGMGLLLLVITPCVVYWIAEPGRYPVVDVLAPTVLCSWLAVVGWDIARFVWTKRLGTFNDRK